MSIELSRQQLEGDMRKTFRIIPMAVVALSTIASTACATGYGYGRDPYRDRGPVYDQGYYRDVERRAYDYGFREGVRIGENDGRRDRRFDPSRHGEWKDANNGYRREYGDHNVYRRSYRSGFEAGYSQGYRAYARGYRR
jgi:predicted small secreted protein